MMNVILNFFIVRCLYLPIFTASIPSLALFSRQKLCEVNLDKLRGALIPCHVSCQ